MILYNWLNTLCFSLSTMLLCRLGHVTNLSPLSNQGYMDSTGLTRCQAPSKACPCPFIFNLLIRLHPYPCKNLEKHGRLDFITIQGSISHHSSSWESSHNSWHIAFVFAYQIQLKCFLVCLTPTEAPTWDMVMETIFESRPHELKLHLKHPPAVPAVKGNNFPLKGTVFTLFRHF